MALKSQKSLLDAIPALATVVPDAHWPAGSAAASAKLVAADSAQLSSGQPTLTLVEGPNRLGRDPACDVVLAEPEVSRHHCEITVHASEIWVLDLNSANGTFLNGARVSRARMNAGDCISFGRATGQYYLVFDEPMLPPTALEVALPEDTLDEDESFAEPDTNDVSSFRPPVAGPRHPSPTVQGRAYQQDVAGGPLGGGGLDAIEPDVPTDRTSRSRTVRPELDDSSALRDITRQRNQLAILYQLSVHCLLVGDRRSREELLTNVLKRLAPLTAGFIAYRMKDGSFRAGLVGGTDRLDQASVRELSRRCFALTAPTVLEGTELGALAGAWGSALLVPMRDSERTVGTICCLSKEAAAYRAEVMELVAEVARVATAALVGSA